MGDALGMIETRGIATSIEAADVMLKTADVRIVNQNKKDPALVTTFVEGDVSAVEAAVKAGKEVAERVGSLIAYNVIPRAYDETRSALIGRNSVATSEKEKTTEDHTKHKEKTPQSPAEKESAATKENATT
nr:BMC domain-containing protein [Bacillus piscicola]